MKFKPQYYTMDHSDFTVTALWEIPMVLRGFRNLQIIRTAIKSQTSWSLGKIKQLTPELSALEWLKNPLFNFSARFST